MKKLIMQSFVTASLLAPATAAFSEASYLVIGPNTPVFHTSAQLCHEVSRQYDNMLLATVMDLAIVSHSDVKAKGAPPRIFDNLASTFDLLGRHDIATQVRADVKVLESLRHDFCTYS